MKSTETLVEHMTLVECLCKPGHSIMYDITPDKLEILHMAVGISGEQEQARADKS